MALTTTLLTGILSLFLIESYYWISGYGSLVCEICQFHPKLGWETQPGKTVSNGKVSYTTNSLGMRSEEVDFSKGHILLVGDSVTFGLGVNNDETVSYHLEKEYKQHQVLNLGVPGYGIGQYFLNLNRHIDQLNPKLIVLIIYTSNDLDETRQDTRYGISKPFFLYEEGKLLHLNPEISKFSCSNIYTQSRIIKHLIPRVIKDQCKSRAIERNKASPTIAKLIDKIRVLGMHKNISTLIVLSPALTAVERVVCIQNKDAEACKNLDAGFEGYHSYFSQMMELYKLPHINFLQNLVKNGKDIHHYSSQGNQLLAKAIAKRIKVSRTGEITIKKTSRF